MRSIRSKISPGVVLGVIAILIALSGTSIALPGKNTVDSGDIKKNAVTTSDVKNQNLRGADVAANTLTGSDINESSLGTVPTAGSASPIGAAGGSLAGTYPNPSLAAGSVKASQIGPIVEHDGQGSVLDVGGVDDAWGSSGDVVASCDPGERLLGATARWDGSGNNLAIRELDPDFTTNSVTGSGINNTGATVNFIVTAICLK